MRHPLQGAEGYHVKCARGACGEGPGGESYVCQEGCYATRAAAISARKAHLREHYRRETKGSE